MQYMIMSNAYFNAITFLLLVKQLVANILYSANTRHTERPFYCHFFFVKKIRRVHCLFVFAQILRDVIERGNVLESKCGRFKDCLDRTDEMSSMNRDVKLRISSRQASLYYLHPVSKPELSF